MKLLPIVTQLSRYLSFGQVVIRHSVPLPSWRKSLLHIVCYESSIGDNLPFPMLKQPRHEHMTQAQQITWSSPNSESQANDSQMYAEWQRPALSLPKLSWFIQHLLF